jgi:stage III sporulation protein AG
MSAESSGGKNGGKGFLEKFAENEKYRRIIIVAGLVGIALIFLSGFLKGGDSGGGGTPAVSSQPTASAEQYADRLEQSLEQIISGIQGAGSAKVLVTLEQTVEYVYATEEKKSDQTTQDKSGTDSAKTETNDSDEKTYVIVRDADGSERAVPVTEVQPVVKGVVVVCDGGDNPTVQQNITNAVTTALHISSIRVCVIKAK